jgi:hypothetical protein
LLGISRKNLPTTDELALLIPEGDKPCGHDLILPAEDQLHRPAYTLFTTCFFSFELELSGRHFGLQRQTNTNTGRKRLRISAQMYYRYLLSQQPNERDPNAIHNNCRFFRQFIIDTNSIVELERLEYLPREQPTRSNSTHCVPAVLLKLLLSHFVPGHFSRASDWWTPHPLQLWQV